MSNLSSKDFREDFIQKGFLTVNDVLEKAEGSRGGHIIGHTSSGKPIYDKFNHRGHKHFTKQDHWDAYDKHNDYIAMQDSSSYGERRKQEHEKEKRKHENAAVYFH